MNWSQVAADIASAVKAGASLLSATGGGGAVAAAGVTIVTEAVSLYAAVKSELAANDQTSVEAAIAAAQAQADADLARVLAELVPPKQA